MLTIISVIIVFFAVTFVYQTISTVTEIFAALTTAISANYLLGAVCVIVALRAYSFPVNYIVASLCGILILKIGFNHIVVRAKSSAEDYKYSKDTFTTRLSEAWCHVYAFFISTFLLLQMAKLQSISRFPDGVFGDVLEAVVYLLRLKYVIYILGIFPIIYFAKGFKNSGKFVIIRKPPMKRNKLSAYFSRTLSDLNLPYDVTTDQAKQYIKKFLVGKNSELQLSEPQIENLVEEFIMLSYSAKTEKEVILKELFEDSGLDETQCKKIGELISQ